MSQEQNTGRNSTEHSAGAQAPSVLSNEEISEGVEQSKSELPGTANGYGGKQSKTAQSVWDGKERRSKSGFDWVVDDSATPEIQGHHVGTFKSEALSMIRVPNGLLIVAGLCVFLVVVSSICLVFTPWQQSISGRGKVIIFSPMERPQHIEAPISGRILKWFVRDGQLVNKGEPLVELKEVDSKFLADNQLSTLKRYKQALVAKKEAAGLKARAYDAQIKDLKLSRVSSVGSSDRKKSQAHDKYGAAEQAVTAAQQNLKTAELNFNRRKSLYEKGLRSKRDLELADLDLVKARTDLERALANQEVADKEREVAHFELGKTDADTMVKLDSALASLNMAKETVAATEAEIQKLSIEIGHLESRIKQRVLKAPCDGRIVRLLKSGAGETVKEGSQVAIIAPDTKDLAVELLVQGNDAPLVAPGRPVRLQFAGWPAVQFTGWPSVAVGTFAGRVSVVDAVDNGTGKFRIIVVPDKEAVVLNQDQPWPSTQYLRPGSEVHGWVMLNTVSLGFELWRQFNAFPPTIESQELKSNIGDVKRKVK